MTLDAAALLAGPRGRGLLVHLYDDPTIRGLMMRADSAVDRGTSSRVYMSARTTPGWGLVDRVRARAERAQAEREMRRPVAAAELAAAIAAAPLPSIAPAALVEALSRSVDEAKAWQPPDGSEAVVASEAVRDALTALAERVAAAPFASGWAASPQAQQWVLDRNDHRLGSDPVPVPAAALAAWREAVETEERGYVASRQRGEVGGGPWWSMPPGYLTRSTSAWPGFGPAGLYLEEDSMGPMSANATRVGPYPAKTYEITDAESWALLCREYPLDVTASRDYLWRNAIGHSDRWVIPDWHAMAADWDGVHLTISGYLAAATTLVEVSDGTASVIAGWGPDETVWLTGRPAITGAPVEWRRYQNLGWHADHDLEEIT